MPFLKLPIGSDSIALLATVRVLGDAVLHAVTEAPRPRDAPFASQPAGIRYAIMKAPPLLGWCMQLGDKTPRA